MGGAGPGRSMVEASGSVAAGTVLPLGLRCVAMGLVGAAVAACGWLLWQARTVGFYYLGGALTLFALFALWAVVEVGWLVTVEAWRRRHARLPHRLPGRRLLLAWFGVVLLLVAVRAPLMANVLVSSSALNARVHAAQMGAADQPGGRVGGFDVDEVHRSDPSCAGSTCEVVLVFDANSAGPSALVWTRDPAHRHRGSDKDGHLFSDWYWATDE